MKRMFLVILITFSYALHAQSIVEKKTVYSLPGTDLNLTTGYGVAQLKGIAFNNSYSSAVEAIDLINNGYLIRSDLKIILFDNSFNKISEHDLSTSFIDKEGEYIQMVPSENGIWISQYYSGTPKSIKLGLLSYKGDFKVETVVLPERYINLYSYYDKWNKKFVISTDFMRGNSKVITDYIFTNSTSEYKKEEITEEKKNNEEETEDKLPDGFAELTYFDINSRGKNYIAQLVTRDLDGNCELIIKKFGEDSLYRKIKVNIPEYKNLTTRYKAVEFQGDFKVFLNENTNDFFVFHSIIRMHDIQSVVLMSGNLKNEEFKIKKFQEEELVKYGITKKYLGPYSASNIMYPVTDETVYPQNDYYLIDFHSRGGSSNTLVRAEGKKSVAQVSGGTASGLTIRGLFEMSISKDLEIVKVSFLGHAVNCLKHGPLKMAPTLMKNIYTSLDYKKQESDFIYDEIGKIKPAQHLYRIFQKEGYSIVIDFKEENSAIEVWKIKF